MVREVDKEHVAALEVVLLDQQRGDLGDPVGVGRHRQLDALAGPLVVPREERAAGVAAQLRAEQVAEDSHVDCGSPGDVGPAQLLVDPAARVGLVLTADAVDHLQPDLLGQVRLRARHGVTGLRAVTAVAEEELRVRVLLAHPAQRRHDGRVVVDGDGRPRRRTRSARDDRAAGRRRAWMIRPFLSSCCSSLLTITIR